MGKSRIGIIFGGKSAEHEVSLQSARNVIKAVQKGDYEPVLIGIDKDGQWYLKDSDFLLEADKPGNLNISDPFNHLGVIPGGKSGDLVNLTDQKVLESIDIVFPVLHGPYGEDGTVQGLLKLMDIPFVGADILGSAVGMDKDIMKRLLQEAGIPQADYLVYNDYEKENINFAEVQSKLGTPLFIKPANLGSSVGINKVENKSEFDKAIQEGFQFDRKVIIEENVEGREIECSVLGNDDPRASQPGAIITQDFYSYEAKYTDKEESTLQIPAQVEQKITNQIQEMALKTFKTLCCRGMARIDFFLNKQQEVLVNEINTIPGFTKISMYPKLWIESGLSYHELVSELLNLAEEDYNKQKTLQTDYEI